MKVFVKSVVPFFGQNKYTNIRRFSTIFRHKTRIFSLQKVTSNIYILHASSSSPKVPFFFPITYQYHIRHNSPHMKPIFLPYMVFECCRNIQNQPVSTAIPSPSSFREHMSIYVRLLNTFFLMFFQDSIAYR